ncbi:hypothetical protein KI387_028458 [Taxus chinensis]|uniref:beta-galactosidase n=1 Tax=Taxus chinensis TaxID=29808 RepID=A0AA38CCL8_TAXCH|nr:hypothetical protein KI387_028458 [Taxus chinensis]
MVKERLAQEDSQEKGWLRDGYPRSLSQVAALESLGIRPDLFILLDAGRKSSYEILEATSIGIKAINTMSMSIAVPSMSLLSSLVNLHSPRKHKHKRSKSMPSRLQECPILTSFQDHLADATNSEDYKIKSEKKWPVRGQDHTVVQALLSLDFWILFLATTCGLGSTITAIDNMGQIGKSLQYPKESISTFVSLFSIWNFLGRVGSGSISEILVQKYSIPRPLLLILVLAIACVVHLLIAKIKIDGSELQRERPLQQPIHRVQVAGGLALSHRGNSFRCNQDQYRALQYHGGTNFGRTAGGPFISTSYDYDAPLDEYGMKIFVNMLFFQLLLLFPSILYNSAYLKFNAHLNFYYRATIYSVNTSGTCATFLSNAHPGKDATVQFNGKSYYLPAWLVSILPDYENAVFNTARVSTQTSSMGMEKVSLESLLPVETSTKNTKPFIKWLWHKELIGIWGSEHFSGNGLLEQLYTAKDKSDFLWYTNSVHIDEDEPLSKNKTQVYLHVETRGHALHVFVNGKFAGTQTGSYNNTSFTMHLPITLKVGTNEIALLSMTVGWQTEFTAPKGDNAVALDLSTMSKGQAWVNGHHIGRYFPSFKAPTDGCSDSCDYRGTYSPANCATNCGKPSQEW